MGEEGSDKELKSPDEKRGVYQRDWTKGSIIGNLLSLAWPVMISSSLNMAGPTIDMIWVGKLGAASIAGVGVAGMAVQLVTGAKMGLVTGARAMISRFWGAGDKQGSNHIARQGFAISGIYAIAMALIGVFFTEQILAVFGLEADVIAQGAAYMRIMFVGAAAMSFRMMAEGTMQASGDTQTPMRINVATRFFHVVLAPFLIFGWWLFPRLGVSGAALTNVISQILGLTLSMWFLLTGRTRLRLSLSNFRFDFSMIWRIVRIGIPAALTSMQWQFGNMVLLWIMAPFGTLAVAAHTVTQRAQVLVNMPTQGLGMAAGVLAGQNLGAGQPERAERSTWTAIGLVEGAMLIAGTVVFFLSEDVVRIFSSDPELVALASTFLKIAIAAYFVQSICSVIFQSLNHVGDTMPPLVIIVSSVWLVQLPMAYFLPQITDLGIYAIRWAIVASLAAAAVAYVIYFRHGRWKHKKF